MSAQIIEQDEHQFNQLILLVEKNLYHGETISFTGDNVEHAKKLANSLTRNTRIKKLTLSSSNKFNAYNSASYKTWESIEIAFIECLEINKSICVLDLEINTYGGMDKFLKVLSKNTTIEELTLNSEVGYEFLNKIENSKNIKRIVLKKLMYHDHNIKIHIRALAISHEKSFYFQELILEKDMRITEKISIALAKMIATKNALRVLRLNSRNVYSHEFSSAMGKNGAEALAKCLEGNNSLQELSLSQNELGNEGAIAISGLLQSANGKSSNIVILDLSNNKIGVEGTKSIAKMLETNNVLEVIDLSCNSMGDYGAIAVAKLLENNKTIHSLNLIDNGITNLGAEAIAKALENNKTVRKLEFITQLDSYKFSTQVKLFIKTIGLGYHDIKATTDISIKKSLNRNRKLFESQCQQNPSNDQIKLINEKRSTAHYSSSVEQKVNLEELEIKTQSETRTTLKEIAVHNGQSLNEHQGNCVIKLGNLSLPINIASTNLAYSLTSNGVINVPDLDHNLAKNIMFATDEINACRNWAQDFAKQLCDLEERLGVILQKHAHNSQVQIQQAYINSQPKLKNYQHRLQKELSCFIICYYLAPAGIFKLEDNKKQMAISAMSAIPQALIDGVPFIGPIIGKFFGLLPMGLSYGNKKNRYYKINRVSELFSSIDEINDVSCLFARMLTFAKREEIIKLEEPKHEGFSRIKDFALYKFIKETLEQHWNDLAVSDKIGVSLFPEDKLAILDCAFLFQQILSGECTIDKTKDLTTQFFKIVTDQDYQPKELKSQYEALQFQRKERSNIQQTDPNTLTELSELRKMFIAQTTLIDKLTQDNKSLCEKQKLMELQFQTQIDASAKREREYRELIKKMEQFNISVAGGSQSMSLLPNFSDASKMDTALLYQHDRQIQQIGQSLGMVNERIGLGMNASSGSSQNDNEVRAKLGVDVVKKA